jgi:putative restriction endonuclease
MAGRNWTDQERLAALGLYFELPFGQLHARNPQIIDMARAMDRSANSLAMKLVNFAHLDPALDRKGLSNVSRADRELLVAFDHDPERLVDQIERASDRIWAGVGPTPTGSPMQNPAHRPEDFADQGMIFDVSGRPTEIRRMRTERLSQGFFRRAVLSGYRFECGVCGQELHSLLEAAHIIPHGKDAQRRLRPDNGLSLCRNHHKAFDEGYWTLRHDLSIELNPEIVALAAKHDGIAGLLLPHQDTPLKRPTRYLPMADAITWHRENLFCQTHPTIGNAYPV